VVKPDVAAILPSLIWHYDEPFADKSALPTFYVSRMARRHVTVVLNGDGGDEAFAGYDKYRLGRWQRAWTSLPARWRQPLARRLLAPLLHGEQGPGERLRTRLARSCLPYADAIFYPEFFDRHSRTALYRPWLRSALANQASPLLGLVSAGLAEFDDPIDLMQWLDYQWYLPGDLLAKVDIASMACSLEARSPFLDHHVVEFCAALPSTMKTDGYVRKIALREAFRGHLPPPILDRPKQGFSIPLREWLRGPLAPLARDLLVDQPGGLGEFFDLVAIRQMCHAHISGRRNHAHRLWALMIFALWYRLIFEPRPYPMHAPSWAEHEPVPVHGHLSADHRRC
jgi:asparagine synthase (glutamine-hydrolysing)